MRPLAAVIVAAFGTGLIGLAGLVVVHRRLAERFFDGFARTVGAHVAEQAVRLVVGVALLVRAPRMWGGRAFRLLGWMLVATATGLLLLPWRLHARFARRVLPPVLRHLGLYAVALFSLGALVLAGVVKGARRR